MCTAWFMLYCTNCLVTFFTDCMFMCRILGHCCCVCWGEGGRGGQLVSLVQGFSVFLPESVNCDLHLLTLSTNCHLVFAFDVAERGSKQQVLLTSCKRYLCMLSLAIMKGQNTETPVLCPQEEGFSHYLTTVYYY